MTHDHNPKIPSLTYPCHWVFKVIGPDPDALRRAAIEVFGDTPCTVTPSHTSSTGKYHCLDLELTVTNEEIRNAFYSDLKRHTAVKMVL